MRNKNLNIITKTFIHLTFTIFSRTFKGTTTKIFLSRPSSDTILLYDNELINHRFEPFSISHFFIRYKYISIPTLRYFFNNLSTCTIVSNHLTFSIYKNKIKFCRNLVVYIRLTTILIHTQSLLFYHYGHHKNIVAGQHQSLSQFVLHCYILTSF